MSNEETQLDPNRCHVSFNCTMRKGEKCRFFKQHHLADYAVCVYLGMRYECANKKARVNAMKGVYK